MRLQVLETRNIAPITFPSPSEVWQMPSLPQQSGGRHGPSKSPLEPAASSIILNPSSSSSPHYLATPTSPSITSSSTLSPANGLPYDSITLPPEALLENSENGLVKMVFFSYRGLEKLLQPTSTLYTVDDPNYKVSMTSGCGYGVEYLTVYMNILFCLC